MEHVILVIHLILTLALIGLILLQRSEGGGLGLGTGGGLGNFATAQATGNALTKATTIVAVCFFATSLILAILASHSGGQKSILDSVPAVEGAAPTAPAAAPAVPTPAAEPAKPAVPLAN
jgi:preprotein translocase subunit SecG